MGRTNKAPRWAKPLAPANPSLPRAIVGRPKEIPACHCGRGPAILERGYELACMPCQEERLLEEK